MQRPDLFSRSAGLVSREIAESRVLIIGCGSVGSYVANIFARTGVGQFVLVDPDAVESHNVSRSLFSAGDVGSSKVEALSRSISSINSDAHVVTLEESFQDLSFDVQEGLCKGADLVVAATDDNAAQLRVAHCSYWASTPVVSIGIYRNAAGGEVILGVPGHACWSCATVDLRDDSVQRTNDYGTGRLMAIPGLLSDIHFVSACAAKLALGILEPDAATAVRTLVDRALGMETTYLLLGMSPDYWIFRELLDSSPGQLAFQSIWVKVDSRPECPICGNAPINPYSASRNPTQRDRHAIQELIKMESEAFDA